jgi:hypothetical protein
MPFSYTTAVLITWIKNNFTVILNWFKSEFFLLLLYVHTSKQWKSKTCTLIIKLCIRNWMQKFVRLKYRSSNSNFYVMKSNFYTSCCLYIITNIVKQITLMTRFSWWLSIWQHDLKTFLCRKQFLSHLFNDQLEFVTGLTQPFYTFSL